MVEDWERLRSAWSRQLKDWRLVVDTRSSRRAGSCHYSEKTIYVSDWLMRHGTKEESLDTLRHEVAHALVPNAGHGPRWKAMCIQVGAKPKRTYGREVAAHSPAVQAYNHRPWIINCPNCGVIRRATREPTWWRQGRDRICKRCGADVTVLYLET